MAHRQNWPISQDAGKAKGVCSVCLEVRQLLLKDGTVHQHGPRSNRCPGSCKPPLNVLSSSLPLSSQDDPLLLSLSNGLTADSTLSDGQDNLSVVSGAPVNSSSLDHPQLCRGLV